MGEDRTGKDRTGKVAYQGEPGANSHIACLEVFPDLEPLACDTFEDAFAALAGGSVDCAMIPIDNSVAGRVADIHHLLPESAMFITGEHFLRVHHQLLAPKGANLDSIKTVHSHTMALGQCRKAIAELGLKPRATADTAGAAHTVAERGDTTQAAIASSLAAEVYGLETLRENIEDEDHNTTRFIILERSALKQAGDDAGPFVTSFVFRVRNVPAALYKGLGGFATNGVNMVKLESYLIGGSFSAAQFYADIIGRPGDRSVDLALEELRFFSTELKMLGTYPASPLRARIEAEIEARPLAE